MKAWLKVLPPLTGEMKIFDLDSIEPYMAWVEERIEAKEFSIALHSLEVIPRDLRTYGLTLLTCGVWIKWATEGDRGNAPTQTQRDVALMHVEALLADSEAQGHDDPNWLELHVTLHRARHQYTLAIHYLNRWVECVHDVEVLGRLSQLTRTIELDRMVWETPNPLAYTPETQAVYLNALDTLEANGEYRAALRSLEAIPQVQRDYTLTVRLARAWLGLAAHEFSGEKRWEAYALNAVLRAFNYLRSMEATGMKDPRWLETTVMAFHALGHAEAANDYLTRWEALETDAVAKRRIAALRHANGKGAHSPPPCK